ncbi:MAG: DMT family transporter [Litorimonas sp.]
MLSAGIGIPIMAAMNAALGVRLGSAPLATTILLAVGAGVAGLYCILAAPSAAGSPNPSSINFVYFGAGFFVAFYILSITAIAPRFGLGNAIFFVLLGQMISAALIDQFGLIGSQKISITPRRALGLAVMVLGVWLSIKR